MVMGDFSLVLGRSEAGVNAADLYEFFINFEINITRRFSHPSPRFNEYAALCGSLGFAPMPKLVLVVDDNAFVRNALCQLFTSQADFGVCGEAENGREGIEKAQELHPDVIVMDLSMPVMNGIEAARALQKLMPTVPLIIFSEYGDLFSEDEARSAGVSALIQKSTDVSVLLGAVRRLCGLTPA
jgi:CheY-like chemotaxis protein